jgi:hypothetical protein
MARQVSSASRLLQLARLTESNAALSGDGHCEPERVAAPKPLVAPLQSRRRTASTMGLYYGFSQIPAMVMPSPSREGTSVLSTSLRGFVAGRMCGSSAICKGSRSQQGGRGRPGSSNEETLFAKTLSPGKHRISPPKVGWPT